mmetsp:Transcript_57305/g.100656  ORF Transcript_57305/g.100656 Transcript_57305/m.100656 type:complete len:82 (+) Transcript_57305:98-343(+)|eukprot:CAMPEP_0184992474 /NCGR_PEP_ID=MMETSP1098-20130426/41409_1 /TAXON_ID=89044 /ORGANISM="Spumella elongata, Strain CCAP 955/1" /LENGTH=81 /DNA_ID=CAMNT_0027518099 /DNA_START=71 /DNA_END=316 /DNA_ORIENTATION=-
MENEAAKGGTSREGKLDELGMSSPKRRLMDAKEQAAYFERESIIAETQHITRSVSALFVNNAVKSALSNLPPSIVSPSKSP